MYGPKNASVGLEPPILEPSLPSPPQVTFPTRVNATVDYSAKPPTVSLSKVSQNGEVKIMFSEEMLIPENVDLKNVLSLSVISAIDDWREGTLTKSRRLGDQPEFRWSITEHTNTYISLLLDFDHAVSSTNYGYDSLQVEIKDPSVFLSRVSNLPVEIPANGVIGKSIPSQIEDEELLSAVESIGRMIGVASISAVRVNFVISLLIAASMRKLWSMIRAMQLIFFTGLVMVPLPWMATKFF